MGRWDRDQGPQEELRLWSCKRNCAGRFALAGIGLDPMM